MEVLCNCSWKGVVDGIRRRVKSIVKQAVMSKQSEPVIVSISKDFAKVASEKLMRVIQIIHLNQEKINSISKHAWDDVKMVPCIQKMHIMHCCLEVSPACTFDKFVPAIYKGIIAFFFCLLLNESMNFIFHGLSKTHSGALTC